MTAGRGDHDIVDLARLASWMDRHDLGAGPIEEVHPLTGGTQNVLLRFRRDGRWYVLRRPPRHKRDNSDETMRREAQVLAALAGSQVPHPGLVAAEADEAVVGAAFYLMEPVDGFNPSEGLPEPHASDPTFQHEMGLAMAGALAALAAVDPDAVGLGALGRRDGWLERQVPRWRSQLDAYRRYEPYPGPDLPHLDEVAGWLDGHRPAQAQIGLIHGDFHFANVLVRRDRPQLAAVVDWELATLGDPLLDLAHLLASWPGELRSGSLIALRARGLPTVDEVVAHYAERSGRDLNDLPWFRVLACYRLGIILEGTHARAVAGAAPRPVGDRLHALAVDLFDLAHRLLSS